MSRTSRIFEGLSFYVEEWPARIHREYFIRHIQVSPPNIRDDGCREAETPSLMAVLSSLISQLMYLHTLSSSFLQICLSDSLYP
jgi:hypothetical protein